MKNRKAIRFYFNDGYTHTVIYKPDLVEEIEKNIEFWNKNGWECIHVCGYVHIDMRTVQKIWIMQEADIAKEERMDKLNTAFSIMTSLGISLFLAQLYIKFMWIS